MVSTIVLLVVVGLLAWLFRDALKELRSEIETIKKENLHCARAILAQGKELEVCQKDGRDILAIVLDLQKPSEPAKPKIAVKVRTNWKTFRSEVEKASDPKDEE